MKYIRHIPLIFKTYVWTARFLLRYYWHTLHSNPISQNNLQNGVTLVVTSCNRKHLLGATLESFFKYNTYPLFEAILIEDGGCKQSADLAKEVFHRNGVSATNIIVNSSNLGQLNSIDLAYSFVRSNYVFHLEEDWEFVKPGFIEASMKVLELDNKCLFVSLRHFSDQQRHPNFPFYHTATKSYLNHYAFLWRMVWTGFGFNPSLRRMSDYYLLHPYGLWNKRETSIGLAYYLLGKKPLIFHDKYYIIHKGFDQSTDLDSRFRKA